VIGETGPGGRSGSNGRRIEPASWLAIELAFVMDLARPASQPLSVQQETPFFVVNKGLRSSGRIFLDFYRECRDSGIAILNNSPRLQKICTLFSTH